MSAMRRFGWLRSRRGGIGLAGAVYFSGILGILAVGFISYAAYEVGMTQGLYNQAQLAAGRETAALRGWTIIQSGDPHLNRRITGTMRIDGMRVVNYEFIVVLIGDTGPWHGRSSRYKVLATAEVPGNQSVSDPITVSILTSHEHFGNYVYITDCENRWNDNVQIWFWARDTVTGPLHTNDTLAIQCFGGYPNHPVFTGYATIGGPYPPKWQSGPCMEAFEGGVTFDADSIVFPFNAELLRAAPEIVHPYEMYLPANTELWLYINGSICHARQRQRGIGDRSPVMTSWPAATSVVGNDTFFSIGSMGLAADSGIFVTAAQPTLDTVYVSGTNISGRFSIGANCTISLLDDFVYANCSQSGEQPDVTNPAPMVGLISERDIVIADEENYTSWDVTIYAAMVALNHSFTVEKLYSGGSGERGTIRHWGAIAQKNRGVVHVGGQGYSKDYNYDVRLKKWPPPYYIWVEGATQMFWSYGE
jgi:hypothetical protein